MSTIEPSNVRSKYKHSSTCNALALIHILTKNNEDPTQMKPDPEPPPTEHKKNRIIKKWSKMIKNTIPYANKIKPSLHKIEEHTATNNETHQPSNKVNDSIKMMNN